MPLVDQDDSLLVVVDVQEGFFGDALPPQDRAPAAQALARMTWLARLASLLGLPAVLTEEDPERNGAAHAPIAELFGDSPAQVKPTFGLTGTPEILARVEATGRGTAVVIGFETDVCVAQSALGLLDVGKRVVVVEDAVASPGTAQLQGLTRMARAGVELVGLKGLGYDWLRTVERARAFAVETGDEAPAGIQL